MNEASESPPPLPKTDEQATREAMDYVGAIAAKTKNRNLEEDVWEDLLDKVGWTSYQHTLFTKVVDIITLDRLARLTYLGHPNEPVLRRASIDKAVQRFRKAFSIIHWDVKLTQWIHGLLVDHLPVSDITAYIEILQTLRAKVPTLVEKMLQGRTNDLLETVLRPPWEHVIEQKNRKITPEPIVLIVPSMLPGTVVSKEPREANWAALLSTMTPFVRQIQMPEGFYTQKNWPLADYIERLVTVTRTKLHDIRKEYPQKKIILVGVNTGSSLALQVACLETNITCVICLGFSTSTMRGSRGAFDDRLVELQTPVLFVIGQNAARTSQEQIEALRENMMAPTALVVVGSADDCLQVPHGKRRLEKITQSMVDSIVMDEVADFTSNCISNPPAALKKRPVPNSASIVILDSPKERKKSAAAINGSAAAKKQKSPVKVSRVTKKKLLERISMTNKLSPPKKEYAEKVSLTAGGGPTTSYEIVTGKIKQDVGLAKVVDSGFIQIATTESQAAAHRKWQQGQAQQRTTVMMPLAPKQKLSLGQTFTPMRSATTTEGHTIVINGKPTTTSTYLANRKIYSYQTPEVIETIELDTDEEVVTVEENGIQVVESSGQTVNVSSSDISGYPVVFQDSEGNIQEPVNDGHVEVGETIYVSTTTSASIMPPTSSSSVMVTTSQQSLMPRPNKFIYYKPQTIISKAQPATQYVVLSQSSVGEEKRTVNGNGTTLLNSSKPLIISVESLEKGAPNTLYHVVADPEKVEE